MSIENTVDEIVKDGSWKKQQPSECCELLLRGSMLNDGASQIVNWRTFEIEKPTQNGRYLVLANDIVNEWQDCVEWRDGYWHDKHGEYPPIVTHWMPELQRPEQ